MNIHQLSRLENASIQAFVESCSELFGGKVLDYGCGKQPYREVIEGAGGDYFAYDRKEWTGGSGGNIGEHPAAASPPFDVVLCTQSIQYWDHPGVELERVHSYLRSGGYLVMTGPGCWPQIGDYWRFTEKGIEFLLQDKGFVVDRLEGRGDIPGFEGFSLSLGWGVVART